MEEWNLGPWLPKGGLERKTLSDESESSKVFEHSCVFILRYPCTWLKHIKHDIDTAPCLFDNTSFNGKKEKISEFK